MSRVRRRTSSVASASGRPGDLQLAHQPLVAQPGQRRLKALARVLAGPVGAEDPQPRGLGRARQMAQQQQRRAVGPVQVVEHEQQRAAGRDLAEQPGDGLEQAVAVGLRIAGLGRPELGQPAAELGDQPRQLGPERRLAARSSSSGALNA